jgi:addiction module HigA family antidote
MAARKIKLTHPGKILRQEFMEPIGLSAYALAKALGVPLPRVNDIVRALDLAGNGGAAVGLFRCV